MVMVMVISSALVRSHQSTYEGSFGPVPPLLRRCGRALQQPLETPETEHSVVYELSYTLCDPSSPEENGRY